MPEPMAARRECLRIAQRLALGVAAGVLSHGCQETPGAAGGAAICTYNQTIPCGPDGGKCVATCLPDLSAYGPCVCGGAGADAGDGGKNDAR